MKRLTTPREIPHKFRPDPIRPRECRICGCRQEKHREGK